MLRMEVWELLWFIYLGLLFCMMWNYKNLEIFERSKKLVKDVYVLADKFPKNEKYGLVSQIKRAVISVPINIVEGSGKRTSKDFISYLNISMGSLKEVQGELEIVGDLGFVDEDEIERLIGECRRIEVMLVAYINYIRGKDVR